MFKIKQRKFSLFILLVFVSPLPLMAKEANRFTPTPNMLGELGLNTVPSARMSAEGSMRLSVSRYANYTNATLGLQLTDRFYLGLRQTSESKTFNSDTTHLYPGMDIKMSLYQESRYVPQISIGIQSAFGHKRMAGEYLALSKRYENFDVTLGLGWGRLGSRMSLPNPVLLTSLDKSERVLDGENPNSPSDWFTGDIGIFGGVEYATPIECLSLKADWSSDGWKAEKESDKYFKAPSPLSFGLSYQPIDWVDSGLSYNGRNLMARLTFHGNIAGWAYDKGEEKAMVALKKGRPEPFQFADDDAEDNDDNEDNYLYSLHAEQSLGLANVFITDKMAEANINLDDNIPAPEQLGNAARYLSNMAGDSPEKILLHTRHLGLKGVNLSLYRTDLERLYLRKAGSVEEIWQNTEFSSPDKENSFLRMLSEVYFLKPSSKFKFDIIHDVSLSEEDSGLVYRTGANFSLTQNYNRYFISSQSLRLNLSDNLEKLNEYRGLSLLPVRGDIDIFTQNRVVLERSYLMGLATLAENLHVASAFGYLEEMYSGYMAKILYRPFDKNWALGFDAALAFKRDPYSIMALDPSGDRILTGFINAYYEPFNTGLTFKASLGRFLGGDKGGMISVSNEFLNGAKLSADLSYSTQSDTDIYGGKTNLFSGIRVMLPLGSLPYIPDGSSMIINAVQLGRNTSQRLDSPLTLYDASEPLSYRHITRHWSNLSGVSSR